MLFVLLWCALLYRRANENIIWLPFIVWCQELLLKLWLCFNSIITLLFHGNESLAVRYIYCLWLHYVLAFVVWSVIVHMKSAELIYSLCIPVNLVYLVFSTKPLITGWVAWPKSSFTLWCFIYCIPTKLSMWEMTILFLFLNHAMNV